MANWFGTYNLASWELAHNDTVAEFSNARFKDDQNLSALQTEVFTLIESNGMRHKQSPKTFIHHFKMTPTMWMF